MTSKIVPSAISEDQKNSLLANLRLINSPVKLQTIQLEDNNNTIPFQNGTTIGQKRGRGSSSVSNKALKAHKFESTSSSTNSRINANIARNRQLGQNQNSTQTEATEIFNSVASENKIPELSESIRKFNFVPPPSAPVFYPTEEEWYHQSPFDFIAKCQAEASYEFGMCKIVPPKSFKPPCPLDMGKFKFRPRIQHLSELGAIGRSRTSFINKLAQFWDLQGINIQLPEVENQILDLFMLDSIVTQLGYYQNVCENKLWGHIATELGLKQSSAQQCKNHYQKLLLPMHVFRAHFGNLNFSEDYDVLESLFNKTTYGIKYTKEEILNGQNYDPNNQKRKRRRLLTSDAFPDIKDMSESARKELKKLQSNGAGPRMAAIENNMEIDQGNLGSCIDGTTDANTNGTTNNSLPEVIGSTNGTTIPVPVTPIIQDDTLSKPDLPEIKRDYTKVCRVCKLILIKGQNDIISCTLCGLKLHKKCILPKPPDMPKKDRWRCLICTIKKLQNNDQKFRDKHKSGGLQNEVLHEEDKGKTKTNVPKTRQSKNQKAREQANQAAAASGKMFATTRPRKVMTTTARKSKRIKNLDGEEHIEEMEVETKTEIKAEVRSSSPTTDTTNQDSSDENIDYEAKMPSASSFGMGNMKNAFNGENQPYGFGQSERTYTIPQYLIQAVKFKNDYFKKINPEYDVKAVLPKKDGTFQELNLSAKKANETCNLIYKERSTKGINIETNIPISIVEHEYWRRVDQVQCHYESDISVEYGADIEVLRFGSGFPHDIFNQTHMNKNEIKDYQKYADNGWNLCNLTYDDKSLFKRLDGHISGIKVPWSYVGMCYSAFAWHTEDHWNSAINYNHFGEAKIWYCVPGRHATKLESCMKKYHPDVDSSELVHHVTTTLNPHVLRHEGVNCSRLEQHPGEYIIQFPRCYHTGFNSGFNFCEAVNFSTACWAKMGRQSLSNYRRVKRFNIFPHDELICRTAVDYTKLSLDMADFISEDLKQARDFERRMRRRIQTSYGITRTRKEFFEEIEYDDRQCVKCQMLLFLSAIQYDPIREDDSTIVLDPNKPKPMYCLHHADIARGNGDNFVLIYRYSLTDIDGIIERLEKHMGKYKNWIEVVSPSYDEFRAKQKLDQMLKIPERQSILNTWQIGINDVEKFGFPKTLKYWQIKFTFMEIDKCDDAIDKILEEEVKVTCEEVKLMIRVLARYPIFFDELEEEVTKITDDVASFIKVCLTLKKGFNQKYLGIYQIPGLDAKLPSELIDPPNQHTFTNNWPTPTTKNLLKFQNSFKSKQPLLDHSTFIEENKIINNVIETNLWHEKLEELISGKKDLEEAIKLLAECPNHNSCITPRRTLQKLIEKAKDFDSKCSIVFNLHPAPSIEFLDSLENEAAENIELNNQNSLSGLKTITDTINEIDNFRDKIREFILPDTALDGFRVQKPTYDFVKFMQKEGKLLHVRDLNKEIEILNERIVSADEWIYQCQSLFIPSSRVTSHLLEPYTLNDVIIPCYAFIHSKAKELSVDDQARWVKYPRNVCAVIQALKGVKVLGFLWVFLD